jgi:hypothetical protein
VFNPLVDSFAQLTDAQIEQKIIELGRKYWQARNPGLQMQIATILEMYKEEAKARRAQQYQKMQQDGNKGLDGLINVS